MMSQFSVATKWFHCALILLMANSPSYAQLVVKADSIISITSVADGYPMISPDGKRIVFQSNRSGDNEIYVMNLDGSNLIRLTDDPANDRTPAWSPNGEMLAFVSTRDGNYDVFTMDKDGENQKNLTNNHRAKDIHPYWSPDSQTILFNSSRVNDTYDIYTMSADGSHQTKLRKESGEATHAQFSPDGKKIAFRKFVAEENSNSEIFIMNIDDHSEKRLTIDKSFDYAPAWSPNGNYLVFVSDRDSGRDAIFIIDLKSKEIQQIKKPALGQSLLTPTWATAHNIYVSNQTELATVVSLIVLK